MQQQTGLWKSVSLQTKTFNKADSSFFCSWEALAQPNSNLNPNPTQANPNLNPNTNPGT